MSALKQSLGKRIEIHAFSTEWIPHFEVIVFTGKVFPLLFRIGLLGIAQEYFPCCPFKKSYFEHRIAPFVIKYLGDSLSLIRLFNIVDNE